jgi:hypothetical protein
VLIAAACGAGDDVERPAGPQATAGREPATTRATFVAKARSICTEAWQTPPAEARGASPERLLELGMDTWAGVVRDLRRLEPPPLEKRRVDRMLTHFENAIRAARQAPNGDDEAALAIFAGLFDQGSKGAAIAHSYGLAVCSPVPPMPSADELLENDAFREAMEQFVGQLRDPRLPTLTQP